MALCIQIALITISLVLKFPGPENLILIIFFCWLQDLCLNIDYPKSLLYEKKTELDSGFFSFLFFEGLKLIPICVIKYLCTCLYIWGIGHIKVYLLLIYYQLTSVDIISAHPNILLYMSLLVVYTILSIFMCFLLWKNKVILLNYLTIFFENRTSNNQAYVNARLFLSRCEKGKKIYFFKYYLLIVGFLIQTKVFITFFLLASCYYTSGLIYIAAVVICGLTHFFCVFLKFIIFL